MLKGVKVKCQFGVNSDLFQYLLPLYRLLNVGVPFTRGICQMHSHLNCSCSVNILLNFKIQTVSNNLHATPLLGDLF